MCLRAIKNKALQPASAPSDFCMYA